MHYIQNSGVMILVSLYTIYVTRLCPLQKVFPASYLCNDIGGGVLAAKKPFLCRTQLHRGQKLCFPSARSVPLPGKLHQINMWANAWSLACKNCMQRKDPRFLQKPAFSQNILSQLLLLLKILEKYLKVQSYLGKCHTPNPVPWENLQLQEDPGLGQAV